MCLDGAGRRSVATNRQEFEVGGGVDSRTLPVGAISGGTAKILRGRDGVAKRQEGQAVVGKESEGRVGSVAKGRGNRDGRG